MIHVVQYINIEKVCRAEGGEVNICTDMVASDNQCTESEMAMGQDEEQNIKP